MLAVVADASTRSRNGEAELRKDMMEPVNNQVIAVSI